MKGFQMKNLLFLPLFIILISPIVAMATDYYYCDCQAGADNQCVAGSDSNAGTNPTSPRQTMPNALALFSNMAAGDSIHLCRGGSFTASNGYRLNNNSTAENPVTLTDYISLSTPTSTARPKITIPTSNTIFNLDSSSYRAGYNFSNLHLICTGCTDGSASAFFIYDNVHYVNIDNVLIDGFDKGLYPGTHTNRPSHITLTNSEIRNSLSFGVLGSADYWTMENNYIHHSGQQGVFDHSIYVSGGNHIVIRGNELYKSSIDNNNSCQGTSLEVHGVVDDLLIENNYLHEDVGFVHSTCFGMGIDTGYNKLAEGFSNVVIRGNRLYNFGFASISVNACNTCTIENNLIVNRQNSWQNSIQIPDNQRGANDLPMTAVTIRNNTIYNTSNAQSRGIDMDGEGTNHVVVGNVIYYTGTGNFTCLKANLSPSAYTSIDNNLCYFPNASANSEWESGSGTSPTPLAAWRAVAGFGGNSAYANPNFTDAANNDFTSTNSSGAMVGKGHPTLSAPLDLKRKNRDTQPDAGAFEFGAYNPPAATTLFLN